ncbi:MAG: hypothetical protein AAGU11_17100 [Syntrophobacteraceae bacterium]
MYRAFFVAAVVLMVGFGCSKDHVNRSIYDGLKREPVTSDGSKSMGPPLKEPMSYDQYKFERERALEKPVEIQ